MARELDNILDQFLTKGYEACSREFNAVELHREHGVCIKIKKNIMDYSVYIKVHSEIKLIGTVARHIIKLVIDELGSDVITGSSYNYSQVEIRVPAMGLNYRKLESIVDIFYMRFTADYLGLIQSQQMGAYRAETIADSYEALSDTNVPSGENRDYSHESRVHHNDSSSTRNYSSSYSHSSDENKRKSFIASGIVLAVVFIVVVSMIISCTMNSYDVYGYFIDKYTSSYSELTVYEEVEHDLVDGEMISYTYRYDTSVGYAALQEDIDDYIEYLEESWSFRLYSGNTYEIEGASYLTTHMSYQEDCYIYFGYKMYEDGYDNYYMQITFICEYLY